MMRGIALLQGERSVNRRQTRQVATTLGLVLTMATVGSHAASIGYSFSTGTVAEGSNA